MEISVRLFHTTADMMGSSRLTLNVDEPATCGELRQKLAECYPSLAARLPSLRFAVNHEFAADEDPVTAQDEVALIGLVSGG